MRERHAIVSHRGNVYSTELKEHHNDPQVARPVHDKKQYHLHVIHKYHLYEVHTVERV